jgi:hypothetical protein
MLDPIGGSILARELERIGDELFKADWAEAKARVGDGVNASHLARTPAQRRADALVEMARRSGGGTGGGGGRPLFNVLVGYETFAGMICQLGNGTVVTPGSLRPWLDEAWVQRVVFDGPSRVIDVGERRRFFTGATRTAVQLRDQKCFHDDCEAPAESCQVDHVVPWAEGGPTTQANGRAACAFHNRERQRPP